VMLHWVERFHKVAFPNLTELGVFWQTHQVD
jgi:hypothetical protein